MARRVLFTVFFSSLLLAFSASTVFSVRSPEEIKKYNPYAKRVVDYALVADDVQSSSGMKGGNGTGQSLGFSGPAASPGNVAGDTYREYQGNSSIGRMIRTGRAFDTGLADSLTIIHFTWYDLPGPDLSDNGPAYNLYDAASGSYGPSDIKLTFSPESAPFNNMDITRDNRAVITGHYTFNGDGAYYTPAAWYDAAPGDGGMSSNRSLVDSALWKFMNPYTAGDRNTIWPHIAVQNRPTGEIVTHIAAITFNGGGGGQVGYYYRKESASGSIGHVGSLSSCPALSVTGWECPYIYTTMHQTTAMVEASKKSGKMALFWISTVPTGPGDTIPADLGGVGANRTRSDAYYQSSDDYGVTFNPKVNITHTDTLTSDWSPGSDIDGLWTGEPPNEEFHMIWDSWNWKRQREEGFFPFSTRIFHWAESFPGMGLPPRAAMVSATADPETCSPIIFSSYLAKVSVAQCNDYIYVLAVDNWEGHDDPLNPDCAQRAYDGSGAQAVNAELVVSISDDNGVTWDLPHNLTNTPTPHCDSAGGPVGPCDCDYYPSMTPHGVATYSSDDWSGTIKVNPRPAVSYPDVVGAEWLDIQYINDPDPGAAAGGAPVGMWSNSPVRHFRMACVPPDQIPVWTSSISEIGFPTFVKPTQMLDIDVTIENTGNAPLNYSSITAEEDTGPAGWLQPIDFALFIDEGANNTDDATIRLNASSISVMDVNTAGGSLVFYGRVLFDHDAPSDVDTIPVTFIVTDTIRLPSWDTISTGVISLAVANNGQFGGGDNAGISGVRLDYFNDALECDTVDSIPGATEVYCYDGSFAVGGIVGSDTIMSNQIFSQGLRQESSVYPVQNNTAPTVDGVVETWNSGKLVNHDSTLAFSVRWVSPQVTMTWGTQANKTWHADQQFVTRELKVWPNDGAAHNGLAIGDAIDWDVPSDSGSNNTGEADGTRRLLYQVGGEYNQDGAVECQDNDYRYAGVAFGFLRAYWDHDANGATGKKWTIRDSVGYGGYVQSNSRYVYTGWDDDELYANMEGASGYVPWTHGNPDSQVTDLHSVLTGAFDYDLLAGDSVAIYTVYATVRNDPSRAGDRIKDLASKGRSFAYYFTCCRGTRGDLNGDGAEANVLDLTFAVDRIFRGGTQAACFGEGDANSDKSVLDVLDLTFLVDRVFRGGPAPNACSSAPL